jgi:hypothetical protein
MTEIFSDTGKRDRPIFLETSLSPVIGRHFFKEVDQVSGSLLYLHIDNSSSVDVQTLH